MNRDFTQGVSRHCFLNERKVRVIRTGIWLFCFWVLVPSSATAEVFKCKQNGQFVFQAVPCHPSQGEGVQALSCPKSSLEYERLMQSGKDTANDRFCVIKAREREHRERLEAERQQAIEQKKLKEKEKRAQFARQRLLERERVQAEREYRAKRTKQTATSSRYAFSMNDAFATKCTVGISGSKDEIVAAVERKLEAPCRSTEDYAGTIIIECKRVLTNLVVSTNTLDECEDIRRNLLKATRQ